MPARLLERFEATLADPDLLSLRAEIGLVDARLAGLVAGVDGDEPAGAPAWGEVADLLLRRARLVESERKRLVEANLLIPTAQVAALLSAVKEIILKHAPDPEAQRAISREIERLLDLPEPTPGIAGSADPRPAAPHPRR